MVDFPLSIPLPFDFNFFCLVTNKDSAFRTSLTSISKEAHDSASSSSSSSSSSFVLESLTYRSPTTISRS